MTKRPNEEKRPMCGIIGYLGPRPAAPILLEGLKRLEYRGYDSAGLAVLDGGALTVEKRAGKISDLTAALHGALPPGGCGIAHTRWATHGPPDRVNAHPQVSTAGDIAVVHNGIIENAARLRPWLRDRGYAFRSETDTEVLVHLMDFAFRDTDLLEDAVASALARAEGAYGIAVVTSRDPRQDRGGVERQPPATRHRFRERALRGFGCGGGGRAHPESRAAQRRGLRRSHSGGVPDLRPGATGGAARVLGGRVGRGGSRQGRLRPLHVQGDPRTARHPA